MSGRYRKDWDELAAREPYFAVLTDERFLRDRLDDGTRRRFFETGEADVERLLTLIREEAGFDRAPGSALDFGCGVGRLTLALARRVPEVTGCDVAPEMITEARRNAADAGLTNTRFVTSLDAIADQRFDLICSLIVFQHIPVAEGLATLERLLLLLAPGGVAALHFSLRRPGARLRRLARRLRGAFPLLHQVILRLRGDRIRLPYMQMNAYEEREIVRRFTAATGREPRIVARRDGDIDGAIFIGRRSASPES